MLSLHIHDLACFSDRMTGEATAARALRGTLVHSVNRQTTVL